jgi:dihydrofolate reductase
MILSAIVAADENMGIGKNNALMWSLPNDLKFFKKVTLGHTVIMGRKTYESMGKALGGRTNIVITGNKDFRPSDALVFDHPGRAIEYAKQKDDPEVFILGGESIFRQTMAMLNRIYFTRVHHIFDAEVFFPSFNPDEWVETFREAHEKDERHAFSYTFHIYERKE